MRKFQFYLSGESPHTSANDVESAKAEYANALERQRSLSLEVGAEEGVIIKHKPARPPPVVLQPQAQSVPENTRPKQITPKASVKASFTEELPSTTESTEDLPPPKVLPEVPILNPAPYVVSAIKRG